MDVKNNFLTPRKMMGKEDDPFLWGPSQFSGANSLLKIPVGNQPLVGG